MFKVFYSWQSDLPNNINRGFIENGLQYACSRLTTTEGAAVEAVVDRDTLGASGAPDIKEMILAKIADADAFVADISIVNKPEDNPTSNVRLSPNPNVLIETGYALSSLGPEALVLVLNSHFGQVERLPFDLRGMRLLQYKLKPYDDDKKAETTRFQSALAAAIEAVARGVRSDPVYLQLYQYSRRMAGEVSAIITELLKMTSVSGPEASLEITQEQILTVCRAVQMNANFPLIIGGLPERGGREATVIEGFNYYRLRSRNHFQRLMAFSFAVKPDHMVLAANVEYSQFYSFLDDYSSFATGSGTLEFMSEMLFSQTQAALKLEQYAERYLARRAGN